LDQALSAPHFQDDPKVKYFSLLLQKQKTSYNSLLFRFVSVQTVEDDLTLEDAVALGLAADELLLVPLKRFCASEIKRLVTVETVWKTLNSKIHNSGSS